MANTFCKNCIFFDDTCELGIFEYLNKDTEILKIDGYPYIKNYMCKYAMSNSVMDNTESVPIHEIKNIVRNNAALKYYLILDISNDCSIDKITSMINDLDIKPQKISFLKSAKHNDQITYNEISEKINPLINWKMHSYLDNITDYDKINIAAETNIENTFSYILTYKTNIDISLNSLVNYYHESYVLKQEAFNAICYEKNNIYGYIMPINIYKQIITSVDRNICDAINNQIENFHLGQYVK